MAQNYKVLEATTVWHQHGTSDKVYSIQLLDAGDGNFRVESQWGRRGKPSTPSQRMTKYNGVSKHTAQNVYNQLLSEKVNKKDYDRSIPPIIPSEFGGRLASTIEKEEQLQISKLVKGLQDFLKPDENVQPMSGMDALFASYVE